MIICKHEHPDYTDHWIMLKQSEHDDHSGYIASHFDWGQLWQPWNRQLLILASALHDTGSAVWEDQPLIHPDGSPQTYWNIGPDEHIDLHRIGVNEARRVHPYVALLISMHVEGIHRDRLHIDPQPNRWHIPEHDTPKVNAFVAEQQAIQAELRTQLPDLSDTQLQNDFIIKEVIDIISTQFSACGLGDRDMVYVPDGAGKPFTVSLKRVGQWDFQVSPFIFAGDRFECACYAHAVPKRVYADHNAFRAAWYAAPIVKLPYACVR